MVSYHLQKAAGPGLLIQEAKLWLRPASWQAATSRNVCARHNARAHCWKTTQSRACVSKPSHLVDMRHAQAIHAPRLVERAYCAATSLQRLPVVPLSAEIWRQLEDGTAGCPTAKDLSKALEAAVPAGRRQLLEPSQCSWQPSVVVNGHLRPHRHAPHKMTFGGTTQKVAKRMHEYHSITVCLTARLPDRQLQKG